MAKDDQTLDVKQLQAELADARMQIEELQKQLEEGSPENLQELAARAQADLQNAKMRMEREATEIRKFAMEGFLLKLLPTLDNLQRAMEHTDDPGLVAIEKELLKQLTDAGLEKMEALGEVVDPEKHEVLQAGPGEEGKVVQVLEEGYLLHGKVIRPAKVVVGSGG